jgi:tetratricopeptide (TPR) repeat protein
MIRKLKSLTLLAFLLSCLHLAPAQTNTESLPTGVVVGTVAVQSAPEQSYAVYLPDDYSPQKQWPTIFCLDPRARGKSAIERFVPAAKKYGYIVVCSNNSRNGLKWQTISQIFSDFWQDTHSRFNIDEKRTYAAGFSGGSQLAATFASRCRKWLAGVIADGAGFPADIQPDANTSFAYYGIVGVDDFNFAEMWELDKKFDGLTLPYHFETVSGGHEWASADSLSDAIAWLTLQAMRSGAVGKEDKFLEEQFTLRLNKAEQFLAGQHFVQAQKAFGSLARDFQGLRDVAAVAQKAQELRTSSELKKEKKVEEELNQRQLREAGELRMLWLKPYDADETRSYRAEAREKVKEWRKKRELQIESPDRRLARRILSSILIECIEAAQANLQQKDYAAALKNYELARETDPRSFNLAYEMARVYALKGEKKSALQTLEESVSLGFKDVSRLKGEEAFVTFADEPRFQKLLATLSLR